MADPTTSDARHGRSDRRRGGRTGQAAAARGIAQSAKRRSSLPFPPLDGGRMLMITLKRFFGDRISLRAEQLTYMVGFVFLFAFLIWVTGYDIVRSLGGGGT